MSGVALVATLRPLRTTVHLSMRPLMAAAWRSVLWLFLFAAVSGFGMGGRGRHSLGGEDGGPGLPIVNFSVEHGDLRVSHFFSLQAGSTGTTHPSTLKHLIRTHRFPEDGDHTCCHHRSV